MERSGKLAGSQGPGSCVTRVRLEQVCVMESSDLLVQTWRFTDIES